MKLKDNIIQKINSLFNKRNGIYSSVILIVFFYIRMFYIHDEPFTIFVAIKYFLFSIFGAFMGLTGITIFFYTIIETLRSTLEEKIMYLVIGLVLYYLKFKV